MEVLSLSTQKDKLLTQCATTLVEDYIHPLIFKEFFKYQSSSLIFTTILPRNLKVKQSLCSSSNSCKFLTSLKYGVNVMVHITAIVGLWS